MQPILRALRLGAAALAPILLLNLLLAPTAWGQAAAGTVSFVSGAATLVRDAQGHALANEDQVHEGDRLETGADGHVQLRMVDGAVLSLRSDSALSIERYRYTPDAPEDSRANLALHYGVVRSISGEIGARSRERFRLDTPVAAIGIRGTDFSVLATDDVSRLSLSRGGVVMTPLSAQCRQGGLGPCLGRGAAELFDSQRRLLLEARLGEARAHLTSEGTTPDEFRPPHPAEKALNSPQATTSETASSWTVSGNSLPGASSYEEALEQAERYMAQTGLIAEAVARGNQASEIQPRDRGLVENPTILWGRWSEFSEGDSKPLARLLHGSDQPRDNLLVNSVFGMVENTVDQRRLPDSGKAYFNLNRHETYIKRGDELETAAISHPGLVVDFEQQSFAARLDVHADSLDGPVPVVGGGALSRKGIMLSNSDSPSQMAGVIGKEAAEAGLLFQYQIKPGTDAVGATHWARDRHPDRE